MNPEYLPAAKAASMAGLKLTTFYAYDRDRARGLPAHAKRDEKTGRKLWRASDIKAWRKGQPPPASSASIARALHDKIKHQYQHRMAVRLRTIATEQSLTPERVRKLVERDPYIHPAKEAARARLAMAVNEASARTVVEVAEQMQIHPRTVKRHLGMDKQACHCLDNAA